MQIGPGAAFQPAGVPQVSAMACPEDLVTISSGGDLDKLDERLAARRIAWLADRMVGGSHGWRIAWLADLATQLDVVPAAELRQGDPTPGVTP